MGKQGFIYILLGSLIVVLLLCQQQTELSAFQQDHLIDLEAELIIDYNLNWQNDEYCLYSSGSRNRKNAITTTSAKLYFPALSQASKEARNVFIVLWPIPILRSILCVYRI